jgi:hypothetical protein
MHRPTGLLLLAATLALTVQPGAESTPGFVDGHVRRERARLRSHFDSVLLELGARDVAGLAPAQRAARGELVTWLAAYRNAGRYPLNDDYADSPIPIFRDTHGVTCAMAYLIDRSGRHDIVDRIAGNRNLAYIDELADEPALVAWLDSVGLDVAEAARIQPVYEPGKEPGHQFYSAATIALSGTSAVTSAMNILKPSRLVGLLGMVVGGVTVFLGLNPSEDDRTLGAVNVVVGGVAVVTGIYALQRPYPQHSKSETSSDRRGFSVSPVVLIDRGAGRTRMGFSAKF